ncbi:glycosyltransferase family 2 protein [Pseudanabaena sp. PCC 6802]|uniref:glycosyltransferase family 2 protein n=1 Tax=Pseudanabaena sp. PCC 6802 TaxID=118173 RepID=UPI000349A9C4|nr:glycosyltransferase family 2 protein [Pseudanabaena sp. PCC 6802]
MIRQVDYKVAAYITAYEDRNAVEHCVSALKKQTYPIQEIFIVNNSKEQLISPLLETDGIVADFHPENIGIASGIHIGVKWAINKGYDFLWTFDQDSEPLQDALEKLIFYYEKLSCQGLSIGIIAPRVIDVKSNLEIRGMIFEKYQFIPAAAPHMNPQEAYHEDFYECDIVITSGSLISLANAKNVELPRQELFIDAVDWSYCMNFRDKGYAIVVVTEAILRHYLGTYQSNKRFINTQIPIYTYSPLRYYYTCRNHTFIETRLSLQQRYLYMSILFRVRTLVRKVIKIVFFEDDLKFLKIWACMRGTYDGFLGNIEKNWR